MNGGIRWENIERKYEGAVDRDDSTFSASGGIAYDVNEIWNISGNLNYSERLPDTAELFSDGPHHATEAYEIGNPDLDIETAKGVEIIVRKTVGNVTGQFSAFHTKFNNYVFLEEETDNLGNEIYRDPEGNLKIPQNGLLVTVLMACLTPKMILKETKLVFLPERKDYRSRNTNRSMPKSKV